MFQVPNSIPRLRPWLLAVLWLGVAVVNIVVSTLIYPLVFRIIDGSVSDVGLLVSTVGLLSGLLIVTLQWLVLRQFFPAMNWWVPAHAAVLIVGTLLHRALTQLSSAFFNSGGGTSLGAGWVVNLAWSLLTGLVGWWLFRPLVRRAWLWPAALLLGALLQTSVNILLLWPLIESGLSSANTAMYTLASVTITLAAAAIQAAALIAFLRERQRQPAGPPTPLEY